MRCVFQKGCKWFGWSCLVWHCRLAVVHTVIHFTIVHSVFFFCLFVSLSLTQSLEWEEWLTFFMATIKCLLKGFEIQAQSVGRFESEIVEISVLCSKHYTQHAFISIHHFQIECCIFGTLILCFDNFLQIYTFHSMYGNSFAYIVWSVTDRNMWAY